MTLTNPNTTHCTQHRETYECIQTSICHNMSITDVLWLDCCVCVCTCVCVLQRIYLSPIHFHNRVLLDVIGFGISFCFHGQTLFIHQSLHASLQWFVAESWSVNRCC